AGWVNGFAETIESVSAKPAFDSRAPPVCLLVSVRRICGFAETLLGLTPGEYTGGFGETRGSVSPKLDV
ncbi:hypothetical protein LINPERPRIM_LOCUS5216, partial [Linum perenne]